ncbi:PucR family transcriptional regulator [Streptomyces sp. NPDC013457]|uniref:PucR family transcriptional regulator n=1 Tax=Streptomyces sp. NPDC013457 TaxID=3364866 RepID=UPI0037003282
MSAQEPSSAPPTPPAPPVSLAALLSRRDLGLRLLAGPPDAAVHWVHTSEMADPYPYLLGGELLMTAGVQLPDPATYVERVVAAGAAALGFGVAPVYDTVPAALVAACERHGLPLVEVPPQTPFTAVARAVWRLMAEARHRELRRVTEAQQSLAVAAARPAPVPAVLGALASRLGGRAVLYAADGTPYAAAGRELPDGAARALMDLAGVLGPRPGGPASASGEGGDGLRLAAYALGGGDGLTLGVATESREPGDHTIAGVAVVLLSLLTAPHRGADVSARDTALVRLLLGTPPQEAAAALDPGPWTVVHAHGGDGTPFAAPSLAAALGTALLDAGGTGSSGTGATEPDGTPVSVRLLLPASSPVTPQPGWTLGVSAPVEAHDLATGDAQAARALRRAEAGRTGLVRHRPAGFGGLMDEAEAAAYARTVLAPIGEPLTETLRTWLSLHGSWDRTAVALDIHRNTVRQRIARCATLLDMDLDDANVRMELWFALGRV